MNLKSIIPFIGVLILSIAAFTLPLKWIDYRNFKRNKGSIRNVDLSPTSAEWIFILVFTALIFICGSGLVMHFMNLGIENLLALGFLLGATIFLAQWMTDRKFPLFNQKSLGKYGEFIRVEFEWSLWFLLAVIIMIGCLELFIYRTK